MIYHYMKQGTPEWHQIRAAKVTGSVADVLLVKGTTDKKYGLGVGAITLATKIAFERMNNTPMPSTDYKSSSMSRGTEFEVIMRRKYELQEFVKIKEVGFVESDCGTYGCSPDGLVGDDGGIEGKCFTVPTLHSDLLRGVESKHIDLVQIKFNLFVTKRKWWDFVSYYPEYKSMPLVKRRYYPDEIMNKTFEERINAFNNYVDDLIQEYKTNEELLRNTNY